MTERISTQVYAMLNTFLKCTVSREGEKMGVFDLANMEVNVFWRVPIFTKFRKVHKIWKFHTRDFLPLRKQIFLSASIF